MFVGTVTNCAPTSSFSKGAGRVMDPTVADGTVATTAELSSFSQCSQPLTQDGQPPAKRRRGNSCLDTTTAANTLCVVCECFDVPPGDALDKEEARLCREGLQNVVRYLYCPQCKRYYHQACSRYCGRKSFSDFNQTHWCDKCLQHTGNS